jgi:hypothetical protein
MSDRSIIATAEAMRIKREELLDQPLARIWRDLAEAGLSAFHREEAIARRESCQHPNKRGSGSIGSDGSSTWDWYCPDCGTSDSGSVQGTVKPPLNVW